jgi:hypothetical protein
MLNRRRHPARLQLLRLRQQRHLSIRKHPRGLMPRCLRPSRRIKRETALKAAAFYRKALAKYGTVLGCSNPSAAASTTDDKSSKKLTCDDEKPNPGEISLKAGTKEKQHAVGVEPSGSGSTFQLVYIEMKGTD